MIAAYNNPDDSSYDDSNSGGNSADNTSNEKNTDAFSEPENEGTLILDATAPHSVFLQYTQFADKSQTNQFIDNRYDLFSCDLQGLSNVIEAVPHIVFLCHGTTNKKVHSELYARQFSENVPFYFEEAL